MNSPKTSPKTAISHPVLCDFNNVNKKNTSPTLKICSINCEREGYVYYKTTDPTFSFKNVSRSYLLNRG